MWRQKIGVTVGKNYDIPKREVVKLIGSAGFEGISPEWENDETLKEIVAAAAESGLEIQSLHAPFTGSAKLWTWDETVSGPAREEILAAVDACVNYHISVLVMHAWIGFDYAFVPEKLCFDAYDEIVRYAGEKGISIAFENTEGHEFLFALMERYAQRENVGFCWDSGHEMCYNYSMDLLGKYGDRLLVTHMNDNLGISRFDGRTFWTDDLHLLPYDGIADWDHNIKRLKRAKKQDILNFELARKSKPGRHDNDLYTQMTLELYFAEAYKRACKIACRYAEVWRE